MTTDDSARTSSKAPRLFPYQPFGLVMQPWCIGRCATTTCSAKDDTNLVAAGTWAIGIVWDMRLLPPVHLASAIWVL